MRWAVIIATLLGAALLIAVAVSHRESAPSPQPAVNDREPAAALEMHKAVALRARAGDAGMAATNPPAETPTPEGAATPPVRRVSMPSEERREGESEDLYQKRLTWQKEFSHFAEWAELSEAQRQSTLEAIADMQQQAELSWRLIEDTLRDPEVQVADIEEIETSLEQTLLTRLRTFLTPEQVVIFRRKGIFSHGLATGMIRPLDIAYEEAQPLVEH